MNPGCAFVTNEPRSFLTDEVRVCGAPAPVPMRLPSGLVVATLCLDHAYVANV